MSNPTDKKAEILKLLYTKFDRESRSSLEKFLKYNVVDCSPDPRPFGDIAESWQIERNARIIPAMECIAGLRPEYDGVMNFWEGWSKGHAKSSFIAEMCNWELAYAKKPLRLYVCAKDVEQGNIILDFMRKCAGLNDNWYGKKLKFIRNAVEGIENGSRLEVLTSDAKGSQGKLPDCLIIDELTNWQHEDLFTNLFSGAHKRGGYCVTIILTNAGFLGTWQDKVRQMAKEQTAEWNVYEQPECTTFAGWMSQNSIEQNRRLIMSSEASRLYDNQWIDVTEDRGFIKAEDVDACLIDQVKQPPLGANVYIGIDYGGVYDPCAFSVVWYDGHFLHVSELEAWQGSHSHEVKIADVEKWITMKLVQYPGATLVFDKYQLLGTIQKYEDLGVNVVRFDFKGGRQNYLMAENMRTLISNHRLRFTKYAGLLNGKSFKDELKELIVKTMSYGYKFDHESRRSTSHNDLTSVVGMASLEAVGSTPLCTVVQNKPPPKNAWEIKKSTNELKLPFGGRNLFANKLFGINSR